jgi:hypothetical protein
MADLGTLADQGTPLMSELGKSAAAVGQQFANLTPFAAKARTSLIDLGSAAQQSQPSLVATLPLARRLNQLGAAGKPTAANLAKLLASLNNSGGIDQLMTLLFNGAVAGNGFDSLGHYVRDEPLVSSCTNYVTTAVPGCSANFSGASAATAATAARATKTGATKSGGSTPATGAVDQSVVAQAVRSASAASQSPATFKGLLGYLVGSGR